MVYTPVDPSAVDTETATSEVDAVSPQDAGVRDKQRARLAVGAVGLSALLAGAATVAITNPGAVASWVGSGEVSSASSNLIQAHGCENWEEIKIQGPMDGMSPTTCADLCKQTAGCYYSNIQVSGYCGEQGGVKVGACYLFPQSCKVVKNRCWDLEVSPGPTGRVLNASRTGCKNWASIKLGDAIQGKNEYECMDLCTKDKSCKQYNYQVSACPSGQGVAAGACYLFKEGCEPLKNDCWDLWDKPNDATVSAKISGSFTMKTSAPADAAEDAAKKSIAKQAGVDPSAVTAKASSGRRLSQVDDRQLILMNIWKIAFSLIVPSSQGGAVYGKLSTMSPDDLQKDMAANLPGFTVESVSGLSVKPPEVVPGPAPTPAPSTSPKAPSTSPKATTTAAPQTTTATR
jgi:hypothetical protein